jgi:hypothetical protein
MADRSVAAGNPVQAGVVERDNDAVGREPDIGLKIAKSERV